MLLVPLSSWAAPANRCDVLFLEPSLHLCQKIHHFMPDLVVADLAYIDYAMQKRVRQQLNVGIVTPLRRDFELAKEAEPGLTFRCPEGQDLEWRGLHQLDQLHWFVVGKEPLLCPYCPQQLLCPREFAFAADQHETVFGSVPIHSRVGNRLLRRVRKWIEAAQSYEKNQLGLSDLFLNSLRLSWTMCLLADTVCLLRAHAILTAPPARSSLLALLPKQMELDWT